MFSTAVVVIALLFAPAALCGSVGDYNGRDSIVTSFLCPNNCTNHGQCVSGACQCSKGYQGGDCSYSCGSLGETCCELQCIEGACLVHDGKADGVCSSYGGRFVNSVPAKTCLTPNSFTLDCQCPGGFKPGCVTIESADPKTYPQAELCFCYTGAAGPDFAGYFQTGPGNACVAANPLTNACSCPAGTKANGPIDLYTSKPEVLQLYTCSAAGSAAQSYAFEGMFELEYVNKQNTCKAPNPATGACSCPTVSDGSLATCGDWIDTTAAASVPAYIGSCFTAHKNPGVMASLAQSGLHQFLLDLIDYAIKNSQKITIPDISGHDYKVEGITFTSLSFQSITIQFVKTNAITMSFTGGAMDGAISKIDVKSGIVSDHCDAHPFDLKQISIDFELDVSLPIIGGHVSPSFVVGSLSAKCGEVDVSIHGDVLCNTFAGTIESDIKSAVEKQFPTSIAAEIADAVNKQGAIAGRNVSKVPVVMPIEFPHDLVKMSADMSLTGCSMELNANAAQPVLQLPLRGSFMSRSGPLAYAEPPTGPRGFSVALPAIGSKDVQLCLTPDVFDSAMWVLFEANVMEAQITNEQLPANFPVALNTSNIIIKDIAPGIASVYPNMGMLLRVSVASSSLGSASPVSTVTATGLAFTAGVTVDFVVNSSSNVQPDRCVANKGRYLCSAFRLGAAASATLSLSLAEFPTYVKLSAEIGTLNLTWSSLDTGVGPVNPGILQTLDAFLLPEALKFANQKLANTTFELPTTKSLVKLYNFSPPIYVPVPSNPAAGFMCVESNLKLNVKALLEDE